MQKVWNIIDATSDVATILVLLVACLAIRIIADRMATRNQQ
jgi:hypothetical protein